MALTANSISGQLDSKGTDEKSQIQLSSVNGSDSFREHAESSDAAVRAELAEKGLVAPPFAENGLPLPLDQVLRPVDELILTDLPLVLRRWLLPASRVIGCPIDYLALAAVVIAGGLIGSRLRIRPVPYSDWAVVPNLYAGIVGYPSQKKSPSIDEARKPLVSLQLDANEEFAEAKKDFDLQILFYEKEKKAVLNKAGSIDVLRNGLALIHEPTAPRRRRFEANDVTSIKLLMLLAENPNGITLALDELVSWLSKLDADYEAEARARYLQLWNGAVQTSFDRADGREVIIPNGTLSIIGGIQPARLGRYVGEAYSNDGADGLLQRFLFAYPDTAWTGRRPTPADHAEHKDRYADADSVFKRIAVLDFPSGDDLDYAFVTLARDAQEAFDAWWYQVESEARSIETTDQAWCAYLLKSRKNCAALALIFHVLTHAATSRRFPSEVNITSMLGAIGYIDYLISHAKRVFALGENRIFGLAEVVLGKIRDGKLDQDFTLRDIKRKAWSGLTKPDVIQDVLDLLVDYGWLKPWNSTAGRPTLRYVFHPSFEGK